jgi:hypothetical protein
VGLDFGAVKDEFSGELNKFKSQFSDLFGVLSTPVYKIKLDPLFGAFKILFNGDFVNNWQNKNLNESNHGVLAGVKEVPGCHEGVEFYDGEFGLVG